MTDPRIAVYAGSFDPLTHGHLWMVEQGARLFDRLVVAVGVNPAKKYTFDLADRMAMIRESTPHLSNVDVAEFGGSYLVRYGLARGATHILRGIRTAIDFQEEMTIRHVNDDVARLFAPDGARPPTTVFLMPPRRLAEVSSSLVKGLVDGDKGWATIVGEYVPEPVLRRLAARSHGS